MKLFLARDSVGEFGVRGSSLGTGRRQPVRGLDCRGERLPSTRPQPVRVSGLAAGWKRGGLRDRRSVATERQRSSGGCRSRTGCIDRRHCHRCSDPPDGWGNPGSRRRRRAGAIRGGGAHRIGGSGPRWAGRLRCPGLGRSSDHFRSKRRRPAGLRGGLAGGQPSDDPALGVSAAQRWRDGGVLTLHGSAGRPSAGWSLRGDAPVGLPRRMPTGATALGRRAASPG